MAKNQILNNGKVEELKEYIKTIKKGIIEGLNDASIDFLDAGYSDSTLFDDAMREFADSNTNIYYCDLFKWAENRVNEIEAINEELGTHSNNIAELIQIAQCEANYQEVSENIKDIIKALACDSLLERVEELDKSTEDIDNFIDGLEFDIDINSQMGDVDYYVNEFIEGDN